MFSQEQLSDSAKEREKSNRLQLGFSFIASQEPADDFINGAITKWGLIGNHVVFPNGKENPDGNLSSNLFDDLTRYAKGRNGLLSVWSIDQRKTKDGIYLWEKKINPKKKLSEQDFTDLKKYLDENIAYKDTWPYQKLSYYLALGPNDDVDQYEDGAEHRLSHVLLTPESLVATCTITEQGKVELIQFERTEQQNILSNFKLLEEEITTKLAKLIETHFVLKYQGESFNLDPKEFASQILNSYYFAVLADRGKELLQNRNEQTLRLFLEMQPKDELSERYIGLIKQKANI